MKKQIALLLTAAMVAGSLGGCGGDGKGADNGEAGDTSVSSEPADPRFKYDEPVTLT